MSVNTRFSDNLISSTRLNPALTAGLQVGTSGPQDLNLTLQQVSDAISVNMANNNTNASHARPSMFANISSFATNVKLVLDDAITPGQAQVYANLDPKVRQDFDEWQAMVAAVALKHIYSGSGLNLSIQPVRLEHIESNPARHNIVHRCILMEMDKDIDYQKAITQRDIYNNPEVGYLFYICQNGTPFAIFHPGIGIAAMKQYDASIFAGVLPWHKDSEEDCHKAWEPIMDYAGNTMLDDFCLSRIAWWADRNISSDYAAFLASRQNNPTHMPAAQPGVVLDHAADIDGIHAEWAGKGTRFGTSLMFYTDPQGVNYTLPELFLNNLMLTAVDQQSNNKLIINVGVNETKPLRFNTTQGPLEKYAPVAPVRREFAALLNHCDLQDMRFDANIVGNNLNSVMVTIVIRTHAGEQFTIEKTYKSDHLKRGKVPYMMIWPYIPLPRNMDLWKSFYATWQDQTCGMARLLKSTGDDIPEVYRLTFDFGDQGVTNTVNRATAPTQEAWKVCSGTAPFQYAILRGRQQMQQDNLEDMGMIFIPQYETYDIHNTIGVNMVQSPVKLAVDFGTTSTVCALRQMNHMGNAKINLPFRDYSKVVTCGEAGAKKTVDEQHWLGNLAQTGGEWTRKIFSVAQLFQADADNGPNRNMLAHAERQKLYRDARLFLVSGGALSSYVTGAQGSQDPLRDQMVMNDMKFARDLDVLNHHAASAYLASIYMYAILYLLSEKIIPSNNSDYIDLRISYPNQVTLNGLERDWNYAVGILNGMMNPSLTTAIRHKKFYDEATATSIYYRSPALPAAQSLLLCDGLVSLDIGGGTTDISITHNNHPGKIATLSLRYAGREVMVTSLIQFFRRFHSNAQISEDSFARIWDAPDTTLINQFMEQCGTRDTMAPAAANLQGMTGNNSVRMCVEMLLSNGMHLDSADIDANTPLLRQLIALKFFMMMRVVAQTVRENADLWRRANGELDMINDTLTVWLSVSGTSAQMLQYIFDCDMNGLAELQSTPFDARKRACMDLLNRMFTEELRNAHVLKETEGVEVRIKISPDVREKVEVCYGMLEDDGNNPVPTPAPVMNQGNPQQAAQLRQQKIAARENELRHTGIETLQNYLQNQTDADGNVVKHGLLHFLQEYESIYFSNNFPMNYGLGDDIHRISYLLDGFSNVHAFQASRATVSTKYARYMVEEEQEDYLDLLTGMYLVEEIIDYMMADRQRG